MDLLIFISSLFGILAGVAAYLNSYTRDAESILPDHDMDEKPFATEHTEISKGFFFNELPWHRPPGQVWGLCG